MKVLGITGLIGSGKSEVCKILKSEYKIPIIYADKLAKYLYKFNTGIKQQVITAFGQEITTDNEIDFEKLSAVVFNNKISLHKLEEIVHPAVIAFEKKVLKFFKNKSYFFVAIENALLIKLDHEQKCDYIIYVSVDDKNRLTRLKKDYKIRNIYQNYNSVETSYNYIIKNNDSLDALKSEVHRVMNQIFAKENYAKRY